ncbi:type III-B CRISPR module-associated protein Cmr5 [Thermodesulfobacteriota bacterium B35]
MTVQSKSQRFANLVFPHVSEIAASDHAAKYKTLSKKAGSLVRNSGLMQTIAFFRAKATRSGEEHHQDFYDYLQDELRKLTILPANQDLFEYVRNSSVPEYMYLTREILLLINWHKRLADTLISVEDEND